MKGQRKETTRVGLEHSRDLDTLGMSAYERSIQVRNPGWSWTVPGSHPRALISSGKYLAWSWTLPGCQPMKGQPKEGTQVGFGHFRDVSGTSASD